MSLVSVNDGYGTRIGPKVFSDVPTVSEVREAKRGRAFLLLVTLFLAGLLVAAALAIGYLLSQDYPTQDHPGQVKQELSDLRAETDRQRGEIETLTEQAGRFSTVHAAENSARVTIGTIDDLLDTRPGARDLLLRQSAATYRPMWDAYDEVRDRRWQSATVRGIEENTRAMTPLIVAIERIPVTPPPPGTPPRRSQRQCNPDQLCNPAP